MTMFRVALLAAIPVAALAALPAGAATVTFTGVVLNTCVLTLATPGLLGASTDGTQLSSEETGGVAAILAVVSTGTAPTLSFTAPAITGPNGWTATPLVSMKFSALSGGAQSYTSSAFSTHSSQLLDTLTINAKAVSSTGFVSGSYQIASTVTCQQ